MGADPGDALAAGDKAGQAYEDGEIHGEEVFGDSEDFQGAGEFGQYGSGQGADIEQALEETARSLATRDGCQPEWSTMAGVSTEDQRRQPQRRRFAGVPRFGFQPGEV